MTVKDFQDVFLAEGNVNGERFEGFIKESLLPILQTGALLRFLPPYSPDLNPTEQVFSKVKTIMMDCFKFTVHQGF